MSDRSGAASSPSAPNPQWDTAVDKLSSDVMDACIDEELAPPGL
jgi:hypothetical protein